MSESSLLLDPVLEQLEASLDGTAVAALGGGHGLAATLSAVAEYATSITAVVSVADDGGSSGRLSPALSIPPPGDIRKALLALAPEPSVWSRLVDFRFDGADVEGHSMGNLVLAALAEVAGSFQEAIDLVARLIGARGRVIPAAPVGLVLEADVDGAVVSGQVAVSRSRGRIGSVRVRPSDVMASPLALEAIASADHIVVGPGSLFTSVIAGLRVPGIADAINAAAGTLIYVCNLITQDGETLGMSGADHVRALADVGGLRAPDVIVGHDGALAAPRGLERVVVEAAEAAPATLLEADLVDPAATWPRHDPARLGAVLRRLA